MSLTLADYNPTVLHLVTLPNFLLAWALQQKDRLAFLQEAFTPDGELEVTEDVVQAFQSFLDTSRISLSFVSGAWSPDFVDLLYKPEVSQQPANGPARTLVVGAETIYSPFALSAFAETLVAILCRERVLHPAGHAAAIVAAKKLYFGVGGSLDDFVDKVISSGLSVKLVREEAEGVRRGIVQCAVP